MERIERIDTPNEMGDLLMKLLTDVNNTLAYFGFPTIHDIGTSS
jgi:hypothetical protein